LATNDRGKRDAGHVPTDPRHNSMQYPSQGSSLRGVWSASAFQGPPTAVSWWTSAVPCHTLLLRATLSQAKIHTYPDDKDDGSRDYEFPKFPFLVFLQPGPRWLSALDPALKRVIIAGFSANVMDPPNWLQYHKSKSYIVLALSYGPMPRFSIPLPVCVSVIYKIENPSLWKLERF
jgi:hypothetical protein